MKKKPLIKPRPVKKVSEMNRAELMQFIIDCPSSYERALALDRLLKMK